MSAGTHVAVGFRSHSGWAVAVVVTRAADGRTSIVDRARVELLDAGQPRQPYHAVAEQGADRSVIEQVERAARRRAVEALRAMGDVVAVGIVAAVRTLPADLDAILGSHPRLHAAEGALFEHAIVNAATDVGAAVHVVPPDRVVMSPEIERTGKRLGAPWQKDHKWAAVAALSALNATT